MSQQSYEIASEIMIAFYLSVQRFNMAFGNGWLSITSVVEGHIRNTIETFVDYMYTTICHKKNRMKSFHKKSLN